MRCALLSYSFVKLRIPTVEVLVVAAFLRYSQSFAEALIVYQFAFTQEFYRVADIGIVNQSQNVVVCHPRLLLCCKVFVKVGDNIALNAEVFCAEGHAAGSYGIDSCCMINEIGVKSAALYFLDREVFRKLIYYGGYHFNVGKFLRAYIVLRNVPN